MAGFNLVNQFHRLALRRNQIEPAPRDHQSRGQAEHAVGDGIAMMVIVEKPRVDVAFAQRRLDGGKVHGQTSIVNNGKDLGESAFAEQQLMRESRAIHCGLNSCYTATLMAAIAECLR